MQRTVALSSLVLFALLGGCAPKPIVAQSNYERGLEQSFQVDEGDFDSMTPPERTSAVAFARSHAGGDKLLAQYVLERSRPRAGRIDSRHAGRGLRALEHVNQDDALRVSREIVARAGIDTGLREVAHTILGRVGTRSDVETLVAELEARPGEWRRLDIALSWGLLRYPELAPRAFAVLEAEYGRAEDEADKYGLHNCLTTIRKNIAAECARQGRCAATGR